MKTSHRISIIVAAALFLVPSGRLGAAIWSKPQPPSSPHLFPWPNLGSYSNPQQTSNSTWSPVRRQASDPTWRPATTPSGEQPLPKASLILLDNIEPNTSTNAIAQASILSPHKAVLRLQDLEPGRIYPTQWLLVDGQGKTVLCPSYTFTPTSSTYVLCLSVGPDYRSYQPGRLHWSVAVAGIGVFSARITLSPPETSNQNKNK
jgi:hypothetical protein